MMENMDYICGGSKPVYNIFVCIVIFVRFANDIPQNQHRHQHTWTSFEDDNTVLATEWINPCGHTDPTYETGARPRDPKLFDSLRNSLPNLIDRLHREEMNAIDTSDISLWFSLNSTYTFLHQIDETTAIDFQERHQETQKYVGAFQHLAYVQRRYDIFRNEGNAVTIEIQLLLVLAKTLLCEIETVIVHTRQAVKTVFTRERMDKLLTFRNNNSINKFSGEVDELDNKFAKVRFHEYVRNLQQSLNRSGKNNLEFSSIHKSTENTRGNM